MGELVSRIFGGAPDIPATPPLAAPPSPPSIDDATVARENEDAARRRRGRAATILTGPKGAGTPTTATKTLLGG